MVGGSRGWSCSVIKTNMGHSSFNSKSWVCLDYLNKHEEGIWD